MNRIDKKFNDLKKENKKAFITFLTAGYPSIEKFENLIDYKIKNGVDIIEIGIPFSDPLADGPTIQDSSTHVLKNGLKLKDIFESVKKIRKKSNIPLVFMTYYNIIFNYGINEFIEKSKDIGIDGLIIPDLPFEEEKEISKYLDDNIHLIPLLSPTSKNRSKKILKDKKGFVYYVSSTGTTGKRNSSYKNIKKEVNTLKQITDLPIAVGFGLKTKEDLKKVYEFADGSIIGSKFINTIKEDNYKLENVKNEIKKLTIDFK
ncbi:MAG: tryptophan synthase subunit alpha [Bacillota bacterium]